MAFTNSAIVLVGSSESPLNNESTKRCLTTKQLTKKSAKKTSVVSTRRVQFAATKQVFYRRTGQFSDVAKSSLWCSDEEFKTFRANFMQESKNVARSGSFENEYIVAALKASQTEDAQGPQHMLDTALVSRVEKFLRDGSRVGLERMADKKVFREKRLRRKAQYDVLTQVSERDELDQEMKAMLMSKALEQISRPSVIFARYLASGSSCKNSRNSIVAATA